MNLTDLVIARAMEKVASSMEKEAAVWTPLLKTTVAKPGFWGGLFGKGTKGIQNFAKVRPTQALGGAKGVVFDTSRMRRVASNYGRQARNRGSKLMAQYEKAALAGDPKAIRMHRRGQQLYTAGKNRIAKARQTFSGPNTAATVDDVVNGGGYDKFFLNQAMPHYGAKASTVMKGVTSTPTPTTAPSFNQTFRNYYGFTNNPITSGTANFSVGTGINAGIDAFSINPTMPQATTTAFNVNPMSRSWRDPYYPNYWRMGTQDLTGEGFVSANGVNNLNTGTYL